MMLDIAQPNENKNSNQVPPSIIDEFFANFSTLPERLMAERNGYVMTLPISRKSSQNDCLSNQWIDDNQYNESLCQTSHSYLNLLNEGNTNFVQEGIMEDNDIAPLQYIFGSAALKQDQMEIEGGIQNQNELMTEEQEKPEMTFEEFTPPALDQFYQNSEAPTFMYHQNILSSAEVENSFSQQETSNFDSTFYNQTQSSFGLNNTSQSLVSNSTNNTQSTSNNSSSQINVDYRENQQQPLSSQELNKKVRIYYKQSFTVLLKEMEEQTKLFTNQQDTKLKQVYLKAYSEFKESNPNQTEMIKLILIGMEHHFPGTFLQSLYMNIHNEDYFKDSYYEIISNKTRLAKDTDRFEGDIKTAGLNLLIKTQKQLRKSKQSVI